MMFDKDVWEFFLSQLTRAFGMGFIIASTVLFTRGFDSTVLIVGYFLAGVFLIALGAILEAKYRKRTEVKHGS